MEREDMVSSLIGRIVRERPLEPGPACDAGWQAWRNHDPYDPVLIFTGEKGIPGDLICADLLAHAASAGYSRIFLLPHSSLQEQKDTAIPVITGKKQVGTEFSTEMGVFMTRSAIVEELTCYLQTLLKNIMAGMYRHEGEIPEPIRSYSAFLLLNEILLTIFPFPHKVGTGILERGTLLSSLIRWVGESPCFDMYDLPAVLLPDIIRENLVHDTRTLSVPRCLRISWIHGEIWAEAFGNLIHSSDRRYVTGTRTAEAAEPWEPQNSEIIPWIARIAPQVFQKHRIFIPGAAQGRLFAGIMARVLTAFPGTDSVISRLMGISDITALCDQDPKNIAVLRFLTVICILDSDLTDPSLYGPMILYPLKQLDSFIRSGSPVYDDSLQGEFISARSSHHLLRKIHPLDIGIFSGKDTDTILLASAFHESFHPGIETGRFLTRRYITFSPGMNPAALLAETATFMPDGFCQTILILPSVWLSNHSYENFRIWLRDSPLKTLVIPDPDSKTGQERPTLIHFSRSVGNDLEVILMTEEEPVVFVIPRSALPGKGGWKIRDPSRQDVVRAVQKGGISLSDYTLDCLYPACGVEKEPKDRIIIGVVKGKLAIGDTLRDGGVPLLMIPGSDPYLEAVLQSGILGRYWEQITAGGRSTDDFTFLIRSLPIPPVDWYDETESERARLIETLSIKRQTLQGRMSYFRAAHDHERVLRQINGLSARIDHLVALQYGMKPS